MHAALPPSLVALLSSGQWRPELEPPFSQSCVSALFGPHELCQYALNRMPKCCSRRKRCLFCICLLSTGYQFLFPFLLLQLNIANPQGATMKVYEVDDEKKLAHLYGLRMGQEISGSLLGDEFKGYFFRCVAALTATFFVAPGSRWCSSRCTSCCNLRAALLASCLGWSALRGHHVFSPILCPLVFCRITGGNDNDGFPMMQGVLSNQRVRLLMSEGSTYFRARRTGERRRKSVRGCIVGSDLKILNFVIVKEGDSKLVGLNDEASSRPNRLGPKRASKIRKVFNLGKEDDVRKKVITRTFTTRKGKVQTKRPKIQRLVTPLTLQRKRAYAKEKKDAYTKAHKERADYERLVKQRSAEHRASALKAKQERRSSRKSSKKESAAA